MSAAGPGPEAVAGPSTLLVIGIHREELAFGAAVAVGLSRDRIDVLRIAEGLSGRRPRQDQRFHYGLLHRALYLQLLPHVRDRHSLLIDLHTGLAPQAPCADLYSRDIPRLAALLARVRDLPAQPRLIPLDPPENGPSTETVIPPEVWRNPRFLYVGLEIYLSRAGTGSAAEHAYARTLIEALTAPAE
jgi:hypothetical protein